MLTTRDVGCEGKSEVLGRSGLGISPSLAHNSRLLDGYLHVSDEIIGNEQVTV